MGKMKDALVRLAKKVTGKEVKDTNSISNVVDFMADNYTGGSGGGSDVSHIMLGEDVNDLLFNPASHFDADKLKALLVAKGFNLSDLVEGQLDIKVVSINYASESSLFTMSIEEGGKGELIGKVYVWGEQLNTMPFEPDNFEDIYEYYREGIDSQLMRPVAEPQFNLNELYKLSIEYSEEGPQPGPEEELGE